MIYCSKCGHQNNKETKYCTDCGTNLKIQRAQAEVTLAPVTQAIPIAPVAPARPLARNNMKITVIVIGIVALVCVGYFFIYKQSKNTLQEERRAIPGIYPQASQRVLTPEDINELTSYNLRIMRNEIFARYGYIFLNGEMKDYFTAQDWYKPLYSDVNDRLSVIERKNIALIKRHENRDTMK